MRVSIESCQECRKSVYKRVNTDSINNLSSFYVHLSNENWVEARGKKNTEKLNCQLISAAFVEQPSVHRIHQLIANDTYHFFFYSLFHLVSGWIFVLACKESYSNFNLLCTAWELFENTMNFVNERKMNYLYFHVNGRMSAASWMNQKSSIRNECSLSHTEWKKKPERKNKNKLYHYACECGFS